MKSKLVVDKDKLNNYKLKITTLSPVHIGTGEVYEPTNYVIDGNKLYEFNEVLFYKSLTDLDKKLFNSKLNNYMEIIDFYKSKKEEAKKISHFECDVSTRVKKRYETQYNKDGSKNNNQLEIQTTFKNPNTHRAIIPGSSIKGMLDTTLKIYSPKIRENDQRQNLIISDALLLNGDVEIGFADRRHRNPQKQSKNGIYQIIEVIKPNSTFIISIDSSFKFKEIQENIKQYYKKRENSRYEETQESFIARVGKNVGKDYVVEVDDINKVVNKDGKPLATQFLYNSENLSNEQFGWIKIDLIEDKEYTELLDLILKQEKEYFDNLNKKQKDIKDSIKKAKDDAKVLKLKKQQEKLAQELAQKEAEKKEKERLASLSPFDLKIDEIYKNYPDKNASKSVMIFQAFENSQLNDFKLELLTLVKELMISEKTWDKPNKKSAYKRTLKIMELLDSLKQIKYL